MIHANVDTGRVTDVDHCSETIHTTPVYVQCTAIERLAAGKDLQGDYMQGCPLVAVSWIRLSNFSILLLFSSISQQLCYVCMCGFECG